MKLVVNGCSWTYGHGLKPNNDTLEWDNNNIDHCNYALTNNWAAILANKFNLEYKNLSVPGGSNDRIVRTTLSYFLQNDYKNTIVVIGWTEPNRRELHIMDYPVIDKSVDSNTRWHRILINTPDTNVIDNNEWNTNLMRFIPDTVDSLTRFSRQIILLSNFLKKRNIPYVFFNAVAAPFDSYETIVGELYKEYSIKPVLDCVNWSEFVSYKNNTDNIGWRLCKNNYEFLPCYHPTIKGHQLIANMLEEKMMSTNTIKKLI